MTTRIWSFLPLDIQHVPSKEKVESAVLWLRGAMPAYKVEAIDHGKIAFFDCGGNMGSIFCPCGNAELSTEEWSDWMTEDFDEAKGFQFSARAMLCCGTEMTLEQIIFENVCMFGRFGIAVTDTMQTYSVNETALITKRGQTRIPRGHPCRWGTHHGLFQFAGHGRRHAPSQLFNGRRYS
jgi:hypothetical protein